MDKRFPPEILTIILCSIPDLRSLSNAVQVSKVLHDVYELHPRSIRASVAGNEVGPAIKQALLLVFVEQELREGKDPEDLLEQMPAEDAMDDTPVDWQQAKALSAKAGQIYEIERFFSRR